MMYYNKMMYNVGLKDVSDYDDFKLVSKYITTGISIFTVTNNIGMKVRSKPANVINSLISLRSISDNRSLYEISRQS